MNQIDVRCISEPQWPMGGFAFSKMSDRNYTVNQFTGFPVSTVPAGGWERGAVVRKFQPVVHPPILGYFAYNPSDPTTWHQPQI